MSKVDHSYVCVYINILRKSMLDFVRPLSLPFGEKNAQAALKKEKKRESATHKQMAIRKTEHSH